MSDNGSTRPAPSLTLDDARETFYVAHRACERHASHLKKLVEDLEQRNAVDAWLETVQDEVVKAVHFHAQQHDAWMAFSSNVAAYVDSVRGLAEQMAMSGM